MLVGRLSLPFVFLSSVCLVSIRGHFAPGEILCQLVLEQNILVRPAQARLGPGPRLGTGEGSCHWPPCPSEPAWGLWHRSQ